jgi:hypothetical protein
VFDDPLLLWGVSAGTPKESVFYCDDAQRAMFLEGPGQAIVQKETETEYPFRNVSTSFRPIEEEMGASFAVHLQCPIICNVLLSPDTLKARLNNGMSFKLTSKLCVRHIAVAIKPIPTPESELRRCIKT